MYHYRSSLPNDTHSNENNNLDTSQVTPIVVSGSESEVVIYAVDDKHTEQLPIAQHLIKLSCDRSCDFG